MSLNPRCAELRGGANPKQARYHCPFAVPIRWFSMPGHRGFRMEKLGRNIKFLIFFRNGSEDLDFLISRGIQFQSWGTATEKTLPPILELILGTTSWSSSKERRLRVLFKGLSRLRRYTGWHLCISLYVRMHILYFILNWTGRQCRNFNIGVTQQNRGERVTTLAKQFWMLCSLFYFAIWDVI